MECLRRSDAIENTICNADWNKRCNLDWMVMNPYHGRPVEYVNNRRIVSDRRAPLSLARTLDASHICGFAHGEIA